jgi:hypothetical protein
MGNAMSMYAHFGYILPFLPFMARLAIVVRFKTVRTDILTEEEQDREAYRTHILAFAGFSFAALSALAIVDSQLRAGLSWAIYYLLISFFAYMLALNFVAYKATRWEDQLVTALSEVGTLALFSAVIAVLEATSEGSAPLMAGIATFVWILDHSRRINLDWSHHRKLAEKA